MRIPSLGTAAPVVDRLRAIRGPREDYSDVILQLVLSPALGLSHYLSVRDGRLRRNPQRLIQSGFGLNILHALQPGKLSSTSGKHDRPRGP